tara:strand:- start:14 stop:265 length:252 start_codon:yes stop_codon:yes gene_type:complete
MTDIENKITKLYIDLSEITDEMLLARMKVKPIRLEKLKSEFKKLLEIYDKLEDDYEIDIQNIAKQKILEEEDKNDSICIDSHL